MRVSAPSPKHFNVTPSINNSERTVDSTIVIESAIITPSSRQNHSYAHDKERRCVQSVAHHARTCVESATECSVVEGGTGKLGQNRGIQSRVSGRGNPRTGIADVLLCRIKPKSPDQIDLYVVQLKGGKSGFKPTEMARLTKAAAGVKATPLLVLHDGEKLHFLGGEPSFTRK